MVLYSVILLCVLKLERRPMSQSAKNKFLRIQLDTVNDVKVILRKLCGNLYER